MTQPTRTPSGRTLRSLSIALSFCALVGLSACTTAHQARTQRAGARAQQHADVAEALATEGRLEEALQQFALAIEENPTLTTAYMGMADIYRERGDYSAAEVGYRRAATLEPSNFDAQFNHGLVLQLLNRLSEAIRAYVRALSIEPNDFEANLNLATAYLQIGEPRQGLFYAQHAVELDTRNGMARVNLAAVYSAIGRHNDAVREYQAAAELMELTPELLLNLADSLGKARRYREMLNTLTQLVKLSPSAPAFERLGYAHFRLNELDKALDAFGESVRLDPKHYPALNGVGVCLLNRYILSGRQDLESRRDAIRALRRSLQIKRDQTRIIELLSRYG